jgi:arginine/lysine/ornithine decarboxylase
MHTAADKNGEKTLSVCKHGCRCAAKQAAGRVSAELLCPYPPGVPAVVPGEVLTAEIVQQLQAVQQMGGKVTGAADSTLQSFGVVTDGFS